jgi:hypothetical protein
MSYDISLIKDGKVVTVPSHLEGGTHVLGGTDEAHLNVTYNYNRQFKKHLDEANGIRWLYDKKAKDTIKRLEKAVEKLGTERYRDYWEATLGNAGYALSILLKWAKQHPGATWEGD